MPHSQLRNQLPLIAPLKQPQPRPRHLLKLRLNDRLVLTPNLDLPLLNRPHELSNRLNSLTQEIKNNKSTNLDSHRNDVEVVLHREWRLAVIGCDSTTGGDSAVLRHVEEHTVQDWAGDIVEVDVYAVAASGF